LLSAFSGTVAMAKPMDADRAAIIALFGGGALCEPTKDGTPQTAAHINHCVLCATQRVEAPAPDAVLISFTAVTQESPAWAEDSAPAPLGAVASRPHKPRDPPTIV